MSWKAEGVGSALPLRKLGSAAIKEVKEFREGADVREFREFREFKEGADVREVREVREFKDGADIFSLNSLSSLNSLPPLTKEHPSGSTSCTIPEGYYF